MNLKGSLPLLILNVLEAGPSHGYQIAQQIKRQSQGELDFKEGTLYPALHNLEKLGQLESYEAKENGRPRRYYHLTVSGQAALEKERAAWQRYVKAVDLNLRGSK